MANFEANPETLYQRAMELALIGSLQDATRSFEHARATDHAHSLSHDRLQLLDCVIALQSRQVDRARDLAESLCKSSSGATLLKGLIQEHAANLPPRAGELFKDLLQDETSDRRVAKRMVLLGGSLAGAAVIGVLSIALWPQAAALSERVVDPSNSAPNASGTGFATISHSSMQDVVGIVIPVVTGSDRAGHPLEIPIGNASCFAVSKDGLMLTSRHTFDDLQQLVKSNGLLTGWEVIVAFGPDPEDRYRARIEYQSSYLDVAILRVPRQFSRPFSFAQSFEPGDPVRAYGFPGATRMIADELDRSESVARAQRITSMLESGKWPTFDEFFSDNSYMLSVETGTASSFEDPTDQGLMLRHSASSYPGMSGGPVVNSRGEVLAITTLGSSQLENLNFALSWKSVRDDAPSYPTIRWE